MSTLWIPQCIFVNVEKPLFVFTFRIHHFGLEYQKLKGKTNYVVIFLMKWRMLEFWKYVLRIRLIQLLKIPFRYKWTSSVQHILTISTFALKKSAVSLNNHPDSVMPTQYFKIPCLINHPQNCLRILCCFSRRLMMDCWEIWVVPLD